MALTNYVIMPGEDYQAICDKVRAKTGKTDVIKSGDLATEIDGISGGGGGTSGDERVKYVTFMNGDRELLRYPVISGDTCHDPVSKGLIATPTKEQTVSTVYTYSGWSLTDGGSASSSALTNVTEDRTVYAAFEESARKYTISYYDEDGTTLLYSEQVAYGIKPAYVPTKSGMSFNGWTPTVVAVTSDASYQAKWASKVTFAGGSWADIAAISESGKAAENFAIGDSRVVPLTYNGETYNVTFKIVGFNHDDLADGSGKAGISVLAFTALTVFKCTAGYHLTKAQTAFNSLPEDIKAVIKSVIKQEHSVVSYNVSIKDVTRTWFVPSLGEIADKEYGVGTKIGSVYEMFSSTLYFGYQYDNKYKIVDESGAVVKDYWVRDKDNSNRCIYRYSQSTMLSENSNTTARSVLFGFCI